MIHQLKNIGLADKEAKVYMAMLELGPASVLEISAKAGINRPTAYVQIESLKKMGLVSAQTKGKKQLFMAESPEQLDVMVRREVAMARSRQEQLEEVLPELKTLFNLADEKPQVRFFEGKQGLERMQQDFLTCKQKELMGIYNLDDAWAVFPGRNESYTKQRLQKKIRTKAIYTTKEGAIMPARDEKMLREAKFVSLDKLPFTSDITIYDNKVSLAALRGKLVGVIIESTEIANSVRALFSLVWNTLP